MTCKTTILQMCAALAVLASLAGCGQAPLLPADPGGSSELVTPSDEPEARRRARLRLELAVGYFEQGQTGVALDELKQVIALDPTFAEAHNLRGLIAMRLNDGRGAEDAFNRALAISPRDPNVRHNLGWLMCQQGRYADANVQFEAAMANPTYGSRAKTLMTQGLCQARAGQFAEAERTLARSFELDAANPVTGYNLAALLFRRGEYARAQFYVRRLNNSELANAESLWLGIRIERKLDNRDAVAQLADQLRKRFPQSREAAAFERRAFDE